MNLKTNLKTRFILPWEGIIVHKNNEKSSIQFPEGYELRVNILSEDRDAETFDLEVLETGQHAASGEWIMNVPMLVLAFAKEDVDRIVKEIAGNN